MAEWVKDERFSYECHRLRIGRVVAVAVGACPSWEPSYSIEHDTDPMTFEQESVDAAKAAAEQALREMHDALTEHFAPVLRWEKTPGAWVAEFGCWILNARPNHWEIHQKIEPFPCRDVASSPSMTSGYRADEEQARRHAEAVLRSLGVVFRTEGE